MAENSLSSLSHLLVIMARLRDPVRGCPWALEQNFSTIVPYTIEEAYEVAEAVALGDMDVLKSELGDLLLQVVFHAQMASEAGLFTFDDVAAAIAEKMVARHPHVFADGMSATGEVLAESEQVAENWEAIKATERSQKHSGILADIPQALPALLRAQKIGKRVARIGFDWEDMTGARAKLDEELAEFDAAKTTDERAEELGDVLFTLAMMARHAGLDAEASLRQANRKFERRFAHMETLAALAGCHIEGQPLSVMEEWWQQAKREEKNAP